MFRSQDQNREPLCLLSQRFLILPTFFPVGTFWHKLSRVPGAGLSWGSVPLWASAQTLNLCSCYVYGDFCGFIPLPSRSLLFPWLASQQAGTGQTSSGQRGMSWGSRILEPVSEVRIWEGGRERKLPDLHPAFLDELRREQFVHLLTPTQTHLI